MKTNKEKAEQRLSEGYKFCIKENWEDELIPLKRVVEQPDLYEDSKLILCEKEPTKYKIGDDTISDLIVDYLDNNDEFYQEDGFYDAVIGCDDLLKQLTDKINENLSKASYFFPSSEEL